MQNSPKPLTLVLGATALAVAADILLRRAAWGVNVGILALVASGLVALLSRNASLRIRGAGKIFGAAVVLFALLFALRDSDTLKIANGMALTLCLGAMILPVTVRSLRNLGLIELVGGAFGQLFRLPKEAVELASETRAGMEWSPVSQGKSRAIGRGLVLATPLVILFGALFSSADAIFRTSLENLFQFDLDVEAAWGHMTTLLISLALFAGLLHRLLRHVRAEAPPVVREGGESKIGITEIGIVLGSLALLFGAFLAVQFRYLFAGRDVVRATAGLSYAEYARGGFFELVWVAALALVVLLGAGALLRRENERDERIYQWLGRVLVLMVFCIVASAVLRMKLYTNAFGLTELRIYSTVFMGWLALAFGWMLFTSLAGRPQRFAFGTFVAGLLTIFAVNLANPDALIVRMNLSKPNADLAYLRSLSDDAAVALRERAGGLPAARRSAVLAHVDVRRARAEQDWREMNLSRWRLLR